MDKRKQYIKNSIYLNLQIKEIHELTSQPISKIYKIKLINKDIIDGYLDEKLNEEIKSFLSKEGKKASEFNDQDINNIINSIITKEKEFTFEKEELILDFLFPEELKIYKFEFPNDFFIITEERFNKIFENEDNLTDFKTYNAIFGKSGIFMYIEGDMVWSEEEMIEYKKVMYFIGNNNDLKIDRIFLYKKEKEFNKEFNFIIKEGIERYNEGRIKKKKLEDLI